MTLLIRSFNIIKEYVNPLMYECNNSSHMTVQEMVPFYWMMFVALAVSKIYYLVYTVK